MSAVSTKVSRGLLLSSAALCAASLWPSSASAQSVPSERTVTSVNSSAEVQEEEKPGDDEIVVTGSRLQRSDLTSPAPVAIITEEQVLKRGPVTLEAVVNDFPQLKPDNGRTQGPEGREGVLKANLRGLGASRTLVLVNGRRYTPADTDGSVDLGTIPSNLLKRIEILTGGASAVYGSDAVAGAVNFILRDDFEGLEARASYGQTFRGDGITKSFDILGGTNFAGDRGNIVISAGYLDSGRVKFVDRKFSRIPLEANPFPVGGQPANSTLVFSGSSAIPGGVILRPTLTGIPAGTCPDGSILGGVRFLENGALARYCRPADTYNFATDNVLLRPFKRWQINGLLSYDITDSIQAYSELFFINARNGVAGAPSANAFTLTIPSFRTNPTLPTPVRELFIANQGVFDPSNSGNATVSVRRRFTEIGPRTSDIERNSFSATGGLRGALDFLGREPWKWDAFATHQRSVTDVLIRNQYSNSRLNAAIDVVVNNGVATCRNVALVPGCAPINIFGLDSLTSAQADYLAPPVTQNANFDRTVAGGSLSGSPFDLPAGALQLALGVEYRKESFEFNPSPSQYNGDFPTSSGAPAKGSFDVQEAFAEASMPIFRDLLTLEAGVRGSHYSTKGIGTVFTYKIGGQLTPTRWVRLRGMFNKATRAPNLNELFSAISVRNLTVADPCRAAASPSPAVQQFCVSQGVPASAINGFTQVENFALVTTGGNPNLDAENAKTLTAGVVLSPIRRLNIAVDYYQVKVTDAINTIGQQQIINSCFSSLSLTSLFCEAVTRRPDGQLFTVAANFANLARREVKGVDVSADYWLDAPWLNLLRAESSLRFTVQASRQLDNETTAFAGAPVVECVGRYLNICSGLGIPMTPKLRALAGIDWENGPLSLGVRATHTASFRPFPDVVTPISRIPSVTYFDLNGSYEFTDDVELSAGVQNLFDKQPKPVGFSIAGDANVDPSIYDVLGARFFTSLRVKF